MNKVHHQQSWQLCHELLLFYNIWDLSIKVFDYLALSFCNYINKWNMFHLMSYLMSDIVYTRRQKPIGLAQKYTEYDITNFLK